MTAAASTATPRKTTRYLVVAAAALVAAGAAVYASPYWALHSLAGAARDRDAARVSEYVDFVLLRDSVKGLLTSHMEAQMKDNPLSADNPFAGLAQMFVQSMLTQAVDAAVSPAGVTRLLQYSGSAGGTSANKPATDAGGGEAGGSKPRFHVSYRSWSTVHVSPEGSEVSFIFHRYGLLSWKMVGLNAAPLPQLVRP